MKYKIIKDGVCINGNSFIFYSKQIIKKLGSGSNGLVFEAWDKLLLRKLAIKIWFEAIKTGSSDCVNNISNKAQEEARKVSSLDHINIVRVYSAGMSGNAIFLEMEYVEGDVLRNFLKNNPNLTLHERFKIWSTISDSLRYMHSRDVYHGDLHDRNIIISDKTLKIIDLGSSFAVKGESTRKRESRLIYKLFKAIFPSHQLYGSEIIVSKTDQPEIVSHICDTLSRIHLEVHSLKNTLISHNANKLNDYGYIVRSHIFTIEFLSCNPPIFDIEQILKTLYDVGLSEVHIGYFLDLVKCHCIAIQDLKFDQFEISCDSTETIERKKSKTLPLYNDLGKLFVQGALPDESWDKLVWRDHQLLVREQ